MLSDMAKGWDRAMWYRAVRWAAKWLIVVAAVLYVVVDLSADGRAAEAQLQRIEMRVDSLDAETARPTRVYRDTADGVIKAAGAHTWRAPLRDSAQHRPDTLLSIGPITVVRRP